MKTTERDHASARATSRSVLLLGPRQVGKSTLLGSMKPDLVLNLADPGVHRRYVARPEGLLEELAATPARTRRSTSPTRS